MKTEVAEGSIEKPPETSKSDERRTANWDIRNALRNYSTLVAAQILSAFFSFASVWLATRYLGTEGYGGIVAVIAASQVVQIFVNWTCVSLARFGVEEFVESGKINKSFWSRCLMFLPNTAILLAFSFLWLPLISKWLNLPSEAIWYVIAHFFVLTIWLHVQHALQGAKLPRLLGSLVAIERIVVFLSLLFLAIGGKLSYLWAVAAFIGSPLLMTLIGLYSLRGLVSWRVEFDAEWTKRMLKFSVPLIPFSIIGYFSTSYLDAIFIAQYLTKADLGIYAVAYQIMGILMQFTVLAGSLLMPLFVTLRAQGKAETVNSYVRDVLPIVTLAWGLICVSFGVVGSYLLPFVFGAEFDESGRLLLVLTISATVNAPIILGYAPFSNAASATSIAAAFNIVLAVVNLSANFVLIPKLGLMGAVWATNLAYGASLLVASLSIAYRFPKLRGWVPVTVLPTILGLSFAVWSGNLSSALLISLAATSLLLLWHRDSLRQSIRFFSSVRNYSTVTSG